MACVTNPFMTTKQTRLQFYDPKLHRDSLPVIRCFLAKLHLVIESRYTPLADSHKFDWAQPFFLSLLRAKNRCETKRVQGTKLSVWELPVCAFGSYNSTLLVTELWTDSPLATFRPTLPPKRSLNAVAKACLDASPDSVQLLTAPPNVLPASLPFVYHVSESRGSTKPIFWRTKPMGDSFSCEPVLKLVREVNLWLQNTDFKSSKDRKDSV